ncbi:MAG: glycosyltransferase family 2 protein [Candidatus Micrarchaeota archaeon]|nr:glycosyltransferase family 2 protein [Candidatus Micrarchaeota archaeon]MDE1849380.1 glycosyltransferase family 2 protein [Candidatus Micrarchaeota archaeon]
MGRPSVSIVIPTLNEEKNIGVLIREIKRMLDGRNYEIIIVDGNSADNTAKIASGMGARVLLDDVGKGSALIKGLRTAKGDIVVSMDADLSHEPRELALLIAGVEAGYDICMGSRFIPGGRTEDMTAFRRFGNWVFVTMVNVLFGAHYTDMCYGYRSFRKGIFQKLGLKEEGFGIETEINIKAVKKGLSIIEIPSTEKMRNAGVGKLRTFHDGYVILRTILANI